ncbi:MAG: SAM-dependent methyltransferase [Woeseia sp.]
MSLRSTAAFVILFAIAACRGGDGPDTGSTTDQSGPAVEAGGPAAELRALLASEDRPERDRARDAGRRPADVMEFLGITKGIHVLDIIAAGGYYTEVLSLAVGDDGQVAAQNPPTVLEMRDGANEKAISARLAGNRLPNVRRLDKGFADLVPEDGPFDAAITALNFHDLYNRRGPEATVEAFRAVASVLKPGAILGIIDHVGEAGQDNVALHRIEISKVLETVEAAGFIIEADSDLLRNEADDHSLSVFDDSVRGKTDRFLLRVRIPTAE